MNRDHSHHLALYLRHYNHVPKSSIRAPKLIDLSLSSLILTDGSGGTYHIPLNPPMKDYSESRQRMKDMVYEAMEGLGMSPYQVKRWTPGPVGTLVAVGVVLGEWTTWNAETQLTKGGWVRE